MSDSADEGKKASLWHLEPLQTHVAWLWRTEVVACNMQLKSHRQRAFN